MFRKKFVFVNVLIALVFVLAACAPAATPTAEPPTAAPQQPAEADTSAPEPTVPPTATSEPVTLQVWVYDSFAGDETAPIYAAAAKFMEENPDITIELVPTQYGSGPYRDKFITAAQAGAGPDALMADIIWSPQFAAAELALPIDDYIGSDIDNYYPGPVETVTYDGKTYGLPFYTNALALFYNKTAFENAGLDLPKDGWTWDDFDKDVRALSDGKMYGFGVMAGYGGTFEWFPWLWANGGEVLTADNKAAAFASPEGIESAQVFLGYLTDGNLVPEAAKSWKSWDELAAAFTSGTIAMYEVGDWGLSAVDGMEPSFEWGVAPLPMKKNRSSVVGGANWVINANTKHPEAAYRWIHYITGEASFDLLDSYYRLSARRGGSQKIVEEDPRMQVFVDSLEYARARSPIPNWTTIDYDCLQPAFLKVLLEGAQVEDAMKEAETCANTALSQ